MHWILAVLLLLNILVVLFGTRFIVKQLRSNQQTILYVERTFAGYARRVDDKLHDLTMMVDEISINTAKLRISHEH